MFYLKSQKVPPVITFVAIATTGLFFLQTINQSVKLTYGPDDLTAGLKSLPVPAVLAPPDSSAVVISGESVYTRQPGAAAKVVITWSWGSILPPYPSVNIYYEYETTGYKFLKTSSSPSVINTTEWLVGSAYPDGDYSIRICNGNVKITDTNQNRYCGFSNPFRIYTIPSVNPTIGIVCSASGNDNGLLIGATVRCSNVEDPTLSCTATFVRDPTLGSVVANCTVPVTAAFDTTLHWGSSCSNETPSIVIDGIKSKYVIIFNCRSYCPFNVDPYSRGGGLQIHHNVWEPFWPWYHDVSDTDTIVNFQPVNGGSKPVTTLQDFLVNVLPCQKDAQGNNLPNQLCDFPSARGIYGTYTVSDVNRFQSSTLLYGKQLPLISPQTGIFDSATRSKACQLLTS